MSYAWQGDALRFTRSGASGAMQLGDAAVEMIVTLGMLLAPMRSKVEESIRTNMQLAFGD